LVDGAERGSVARLCSHAVTADVHEPVRLCLHRPDRVPRSPDNFLYVFKTGPLQGPKGAPPPKDGPCPPSAPAPGGGPWLGAHVPNGCRPETTRLIINERHPSSGGGRLLALVAHAVLPTDRGAGAPHRPASDHGKCGPARHASRASRSAVEQARPLTRADLNLTAAAIGPMRRDCPRLET
jgi:hypothetical protein